MPIAGLSSFLGFLLSGFGTCLLIRRSPLHLLLLLLLLQTLVLLGVLISISFEFKADDGVV